MSFVSMQELLRKFATSSYGRAAYDYALKILDMTVYMVFVGFATTLYLAALTQSFNAFQRRGWIVRLDG